MMLTDSQHLGRGFAVLQHLVELFQELENGQNVQYNLDFMGIMRHSISDMERGSDFRLRSLALADNGYEAFERTIRGMPVAEPDPEIPSMADSVDIPMARGDIPNPGEPHSPEHMASWLAGRLTRRIVSACIGSRDEMLCKYYRMRQIMEDVLHCCTLSEYNRRRAAYMMSDIADLSDHSSSDEERDPISAFTAGLPNGGSYLLEHDFDEPVEGNLAYPFGPLSQDFAGPEDSSMIPAYIMIEGVVYYTAEIEDVHQDAELLFREPDWMYFHYDGFNYRVRTWETHTEAMIRRSLESMD